MFKIPQKIEYVITTLKKNGFEAYIVGGCVRDMLMDRVPNDFDITTSAKPEEIIPLFDKTLPTGIKHGTVTVILENEPIEVTTYRTDGEYLDHRRPENVRFVSSLKEDLARRDFTVNAIAYSAESGVMDYFGGRLDIDSKILKTVGNPQERFFEDALRILRLFRFSSQLGFKIEDKTLNSALTLSPTLQKISRERIAVELKKTALGENPEALKPLLENGGLEFLKLDRTPYFEVIKKCRKRENLAFFFLLNFSSSDLIFTLSTLKLSNEFKDYCQKLSNLLCLPFPTDKKSLKNMLFIAGEEILVDYFLLKSAENQDINKARNLLNEILTNEEPYLISHLKINGNELKALGFSGKEIGNALERCRLIVAENPEYNTKEKLFSYLKIH